MDGDHVKGEPSQNTSVQYSCLAEMFTKLCPYYMALGMTYTEFWHCNTTMHKAFRKAWEQKKLYRNWEMWMQGMYFYDALLKVAPVMRASMGKSRVEPGEYPSEPYALTAKEAHEREEAKRNARLERLFVMLSKESKANQEVSKDGRD